MININIKASEKLNNDFSAFISFDYDNLIVNTLRELPFKFYNKDTTTWEIPTDKVLTIISNLQGFEIELKGNLSLLNPKPFNLDLPKGFEFKTNPFEHQKFGVQYGLQHDRWFLGDEQGCVSGESFVKIKEQGKSATRDIKIKNLKKAFDLDKTIKIKSLVNGRFAYMPIKAVVDKGIQKTLELNLENTSIQCTPDHLIYTENGWVEADKLKIGDKVFTNGIQTCPLCGSAENLITYKYSKFFGYCKPCMYKSRNGTKYNEITKKIDDSGYVRLFGKETRNMPNYDKMYGMGEYNTSDPYNMYYVKTYSSNRRLGVSEETDEVYGNESYDFFQNKCNLIISKLNTLYSQYHECMNQDNPQWFDEVTELLKKVTETSKSDIHWDEIYEMSVSYQEMVIDAFYSVNINGGAIEVQLMPFVEYSLMMSDRFESFVSSFTQVHKAIEPVIMKRLEGNNYLDCKLIATYGLPHSYSSDIDHELDNAFWPDLNIQIEFDVKLYNQALATNTINELRVIVKSYFNRLTSIHTPVDAISMDNNIYISHVIQQMETHDNVAYMKFRGWYTNERKKANGNYMDANVQAIVQKWKKLEDFPKQELERFVPEMFVLDDDNIVINLIK